MTRGKNLATWSVPKVLLVTLAISGLLCTAVLIEVTVGPIALIANVLRTNALRSRLPEAAEQWESTGLSDYDIDVEVNIPFCWYDVTLHVRGGDLVSVMERETVPWRDLELCRINMDYPALRIPEFFDKVEQELQALDVYETALSVRFDPELGYITYYRSDCSYRDRAVGDCIIEYKFTNLRQIR